MRKITFPLTKEIKEDNLIFKKHKVKVGAIVTISDANDEDKDVDESSNRVHTQSSTEHPPTKPPTP
jgi:hypothetical protein